MKEAIEALHQRIKDLAASSTPDQLAYLAKSLELIADKKAISNVVQMTTIKEIIDALQGRLKDLAANSTPDQLAYLAKALESIVDKSAVSEIVQMTDGKLKELLSAARSHLNEINSNKENSISAITGAKTESVNEINTLKTNTLDTLKALSDSHISLLDTRKNANIAAINSVSNSHKDGLKGLVEDFRAINNVPPGSSIIGEIETRDEQLKASLTNEIKIRENQLRTLTTKFNSINDVPSSSSIMKEVKKRNMVEPGSLPFLFGVLSRGNNYYGHGIFTTELGQWSSDITKTDYMLQLLAGSHTYDTDYVSFYRPRQLSFIEGNKGTFIYGELYTNSFSSSNYQIYAYPYAALGVIFVKNTTSSDITRTLNFVGTSFWSSGYEGAGAFVGTPDNTNKSRISKITWKNVYQYTSSSSGFAASGNVEIPAGKTVAVLLYTSSYLYTSPSYLYSRGRLIPMRFGGKRVPIYIRFKDNKQIETTTLESKPTGNDWYEAPENFDWQKSYCLTEGGKIVERSQEDIELELLENAKFSAFDSIRVYFNNYTNKYAGHSHQKSKSYEIQAKAAENILADQDEKDTEIIEPLAKVRGISIVQMAELIQEKVKRAKEAIIKCEELEDLAKKKIKEAKSEGELQTLLDDLRTAKSSVIGVIGTAPDADEQKFPLNKPVLIAGSLKEAAKLGKTGTLPQAVSSIFTQVGATVVVIRVENADQEEEITANVIGGVDEETGEYQGIQAFLSSESIVHVAPRILIAPQFTHQLPGDAGNPVVSALIPIAEKLRSIIVADGPNTNDEEAIKWRKSIGSSRVYVVDPWVKVFEGEEKPPSPFVAGLIAKVDSEQGFWHSPSNKEINGIVGTSRAIDFTLGDTSCRANYLNENEVTTIIHQNGYRLWGNRTCSNDEGWAFLSVRRTADLINDSLLRAHLWAVDRNITKTYIDDVIEGVNSYLAHLKAQGAIISGKCYATPELNTPANIASGKVYFDFEFTPPYPAEQITFRSHLVNGAIS
ncbi:putative prophage major tail sheath protein [Trichonephila clavata]|uniref:Putative prophage major tail sheath protein n=1 Tax=Trichonephila clavata TaxID=2740835 RepID=A0A8X6GGI7_TRICU|nr:putative prophage major tail sheath protein [Trichonephila clavata]